MMMTTMCMKQSVDVQVRDRNTCGGRCLHRNSIVTIIIIIIIILIIVIIIILIIIVVMTRH